MKKILLSILTITLVSSAVYGATLAQFSDNETSTGNTFTAGTLDLNVDGQDGASVTTKYTLTNWKPGNNQMVGQIRVRNAGSVDGKYWIEIKNVVNNENGVGEPETEAGDITTGASEGELGSKISGYFQENVAPWSHLNPSITSIDAAADIPMQTASGSLAAGEEKPFVLYAKWLSTATDNLAQGDTVQFDLGFHLEQI